MNLEALAARVQHQFLIPKLRGPFYTAPIRTVVPSTWNANCKTRDATSKMLSGIRYPGGGWHRELFASACLLRSFTAGKIDQEGTKRASAAHPVFLSLAQCCHFGQLERECMSSSTIRSCLRPRPPTERGLRGKES